MHKSDLYTHECDNDTHECDFYMQRVISTRIVNLTRITILTTMNFNMHKSDFYTQIVILTRMSVIMTLTSMITTRTTVTYWI
jgi:hypothetical protein